VNKKSIALKPSSAALIIFIAIIIAGCFSECAFAQQGATRRGVSLEARGGETSQPPAGKPYMNDLDFSNLMKQSDLLLKYGKFDQTLALLTPYEVYIFGSLEHWSNMARYDWRLYQAYSMKCDSVNAIFYLNCIIDETNQRKPTKHKSQYVAMVDTHGVETGQYYFGAAINGRDYTIKQSAQEKMDLLKQRFKKIEAKTDPRMRYDNYPGSRSRMTRGN